MGLGFKIAGITAIALGLLGGAFYWYFSWSQEQIKAQEQLIAKQDTAIRSLETTVESIKRNIAKQSKGLQDLDKRQAEVERTTSGLSKILARHDLEHLANEKPKLIEKRINIGTSKVLKDIEDITKKRSHEE